MFSRRFACGLIGAAALVPASARAQSVAPAASKDKPILKITGKITQFDDTGNAVFDRNSLEAMGLVSFETMTPWYKSRVKFEGVPIKKLLSVVGAQGDKVIVTALNDYSTEIPIVDFEAYNVILALRRDGQYMPVSDKGPLFIVYDFDAHPEIRTPKYYGRSAWQVARIEVR